MKNRSFLVACVAALALVACGDDDTSPRPGVDAGMDVAADTTPDECDGVVVADAPGGSCGGVTPCGEGLQCSRLSDEDEGMCRQLCVPDVCETVCESGQRCVPLNDSPGTGVCAEEPTGSRGAYETCSSDVGLCESPLSCLVGAAGETQGVCLPPCDDASGCAAVDGREGQCVIATGNGSFCAPACSAVGADSECPEGTECRASGDGFVCAWPDPA